MTFNKKSPIFRAVLVILEHNNAPMVIGAVFCVFRWYFCLLYPLFVGFYL
nr:MAG TPA: hypothetical protein [Caudoviricetes sp.]